MQFIQLHIDNFKRQIDLISSWDIFNIKSDSIDLDSCSYGILIFKQISNSLIKIAQSRECAQLVSDWPEALDLAGTCTGIKQ